MGSLFADDAVWQVGGSGGLAGDEQGEEAIVAYFGDLYSRSGGTMKVKLQDIISGERHTVGLQTPQGQRAGKSMEEHGAIVFALKDGKVTEVIEFLEDTVQASDFWS